MTHEEYAEYQERVARYLEGLKAVSTGPCPGCEECGNQATGEDENNGEDRFANLAYVQEHEEPWFSWSPCEICDRPLGGNRVSWHGWIPADDQFPKGKLVHGECCTDCQYYLAYGQLDDQTMLFAECD